MTSSPIPGPSSMGDKSYGVVATSLYEWCRKNRDPEDVLVQDDLFQSDVIPNKDIHVLLEATQILVNEHLFKIHDVRGGGIGWKLVSEERAAKYGELSQDENLVYSIIDNAGSTGIWTKTVKQRLNIHAKVSERCFKTLESKGLITPMKNVKFPSRKMYIVAGLQPSEDATGGAWFTDGALDESLLDIVGNVIEKRVSERSWVEVDSTNPGDERGSSPTSKRKAPDDGFDIKGKGKSKVSRVSGDDVSHLDDDNHTPRPDATKTRSKPPTPMKKSYVPHPPGYRGYPDIRWITNEVNNSRIIHSLLPQTALAQLVDVLVYDDRLVRLNIPAEVSHEHKTVYKAVKNIGQIRDQALLKNRQLDPKEDVRKAALREEELQILGPGGMTELPCARCPVFHLCEIGGPASVENCTYFDDWFKKMEALEVLKVKDGEIL